jgi:hypothetical protein
MSYLTASLIVAACAGVPASLLSSPIWSASPAPMWNGLARPEAPTRHVQARMDAKSGL